MNRLLLAGKSDIAVKYLENQINQVDCPFDITKIDDLELLKAGSSCQLAIIDLSVYTPGIFERIENFSMRNPSVFIVAVSYCEEASFDELLIDRGVDLITSKEELSAVIAKKYIMSSQAS